MARKYCRYSIELLTNDCRVHSVRVSHNTSCDYKKMLELYRRAKEEFKGTEYINIYFLGIQENLDAGNIYQSEL
ncbi:MAG: hypothetical protein KAX49_13945 [Halanaerobiales bacterium]|nr:hypothetical protein [Halanaerobiales bacterium]